MVIINEIALSRNYQTLPLISRIGPVDLSQLNKSNAAIVTNIFVSMYHQNVFLDVIINYINCLLSEVMYEFVNLLMINLSFK